MKAQFNLLLEKQKTRVSELEVSVTSAKMTYAEALRNLEKISDEIHRTRQYDGVGPKPSSPKNPPSSESSTTGSPDSNDYISDEYLELPAKMSPKTSCLIPKTLEGSSTEYLGLSTLNMSSTEPRKYIKRERPIKSPHETQKVPINLNKFEFPAQNDTNKFEFPAQKDSNKSHSPAEKSSNKVKFPAQIEEDSFSREIQINLNKKARETGENGEEWTEISLNNSPDDIYYNNDVYSDEDDPIPYKPLPSELSPDSGTASGHNEPISGHRRLMNQQSLPSDCGERLERKRGKLDSNLSNWISRSSAGTCSGGETSCGGSSSSSRRQSLDILWSAGPGERVKELLNHGMMILNISSLTERRSSEPRAVDKDERVNKGEMKGKKVPSPLEKTIGYLNPEEETSDSESLARYVLWEGCGGASK